MPFYLIQARTPGYLTQADASLVQDGPSAHREYTPWTGENRRSFIKSPVAMADFAPSPFQQAIFDAAREGEDNLVIEAVAGSGKSTTLLQLVSQVQGNGIIVSFNKAIATELGNKLTRIRSDAFFTAQTVHSVGMQILKGNSGRLLEVGQHKLRLPPDLKVDGRKTGSIIFSLVREFNMSDEDKAETRQTLSSLVSLVRLHLLDPEDLKGLEELCIHHSLPKPQAAPYVADILKESMQQYRDYGIIDFDDMIYLPVRFGLPFPKYDWVLVDECQDLSKLQLQMALRLRRKTGRLIFVGDRHQAIYGFAGADHKSFQNIIDVSEAKVLPLSICYRCPSSVVERAQRIVPQIEPRENAPVGTVKDIQEEDLDDLLKPGDLVLCRVNAPLISVCLRLIASGKKAAIRGRDLKTELQNVIKKIGKKRGFQYENFVTALNEYVGEKIDYLDRVSANEAAKDKYRDLAKAIMFVYQNEDMVANNVNDLVQNIEILFEEQSMDDKIWLSSVHRAKGLEAERVFILKPEKLPLVWNGQQSWEYDQEMNLTYVAITRALDSLFYVVEEMLYCGSEYGTLPSYIVAQSCAKHGVPFPLVRSLLRKGLPIDKAMKRANEIVAGGGYNANSYRDE